MFDSGRESFDDADDGKIRTGLEASTGGSVSTSTDDLLLLEKKGDPGGVIIWMASPKEEDRFFATELAVAFM